MMETQNKKTPATKRPNRYTSWGIAILIIVACYTVSLFTPMIQNFTYYPIKKISCGWSQLYYGSSFFGVYAYHESKGPSVFTSPDTLFCSPAEAESKGYTKE